MPVFRREFLRGGIFTVKMSSVNMPPHFTVNMPPSLKSVLKVAVIPISPASIYQYTSICTFHNLDEYISQSRQIHYAIWTNTYTFVTKVMKANIIAFKKAKILRPVLSIKNTPLMFFWVLHSLKLIFVTLFFRFPIFGVLTEPPPKKSC